jgi:hypothetical protein
MKKITFLFLLSSLLFRSCNDSKSSEDDNFDESLYDFKSYNLEPFDIPATIMLPDETSNIGAATNVEVLHTEGDFKWEMNIGPNFHLRIDDWGDDKQILQAEKDKLKGLKFYKISYLKNEPELLIYKRELIVKGHKKASSNVGTEHTTYHIFYMKEINGIIYVFKNKDEGSPKKIVDLLEKSIKSIKSNNKKA